ncbi:MFS transporter [Paeniglutamicibacter sp. NPDC012692]|uniref:MFS transporter n=1 Tax=Paeniglutamicibacter sp. NPDC012692 TaxID=3364388 RepID=UPI003680B821
MNPQNSAPDPPFPLASTEQIDTAAPLPGTPPQSPPPTRTLLPGIPVASLTLYATYAALIGVLLPSQIAVLDEENKVGNFAIVTTTSFVFTLFAQPIVGAISDRTRSRLGRRAPWMILGALIGGVLMLGLGSFTSLVWITVFWVVIQVALNALQGPFSAITADRFPRNKRGTASAMAGIGMQIGGTLGVLAAGALAGALGIAYSAFGIAIILTTVLFIVVNRDWSSAHSQVPAWSWSAFLRGFWINPRKNPDFAWAFTARFLFILGYFVVSTFQLYIITDYIGMSLEDAQTAIGTIALASLLPTMAAIVLAGWWSDRVGRRKVFIYAASVIMVVSLAIPLFNRTLEGLILSAVIDGIGFGFYMACDTALMTGVLPGAGAAAGKDLGILNIATNIPQAMSPAIAGVIIGTAGGYPALFAFGMVAVVLAAIAFAPICSVKQGRPCERAGTSPRRRVAR